MAELPLQSPVRDLRLDFLRGVALLLVLVDHMEDHSGIRWLRFYTLAANGLSDAAEVFVFLSGFVFGRVYGKRMEADGFRTCQFKALRRALSLHRTFVLCTVVVIVIGICFGEIAPILIHELQLQHGAAKWVFWSLPMYYQPYGLDVLAFYVVVIPCAPAMLYGLRRHPGLAWTISLGLYLGSQAFPIFQLPSNRVGLGWFFNPFAWQFLFFLGIWLGSSRIAWSIPRKARLVACLMAIAVLMIGFLFRKNRLPLIPWPSAFEQVLIEWISRWSGKNSLGPLRLIHFFALAVLASQLMPTPSAACWRSRFAVPMINCGQNSLAVYSFGTILMFLSCPVFSMLGTSPVTVLVVIGDSLLLSVLFANFLQKRQRVTMIRAAGDGICPPNGSAPSLSTSPQKSGNSSR